MVILKEVSSSEFWKYHVFLSFRGTDTRYNFTGHLYNALIQKGIDAYMDDPELPKGEEISSELLQAIQDSKISIIVFSEHYASSSWCLDELVKILKCKKSNKQVVHPIFYKVEPSDIRHLKGSFGEALAKHECRFKDNLEKVEEWKNALSEAANLSGWTLESKNQNQSEPIFIDKIVEEISRQLISRTYMDVAKYPVGVEPRVKAVMNLLRDLKGSKDVRMVGIWGTGGMGKTTLAKAVYNSIAHQFEGCCFLENVRENSMSYRGLDQSIDNSKICKLQEKLLSQILGGKQFIVDSASKGITMIKEKLKGRRVLIVLDDVNDVDQLDNLAGESGWFGKGSRVIITTRDMQLLRAHTVDLMYNIKELDYYEAFQLFSRNALKRNELLEDYKDLIDRAIARAQGLPLALTVLGSSLCGKSKQRWQTTIDSFKSNKIQEVLKISYDGLEETTKEVFLDIACFFKGKDRRHVIQMLQGCGQKPEHEIEDLIEKALIRIDFYGCVTMHDLLEEMGKDIVKQESLNDPGERSRLWFHDDVYRVLTENSGTRKIIGIKVELPQDSKEICLTVGTFSNMLNLTLFICRAGSFSGVLDYLPNSLRIIDWPNCPFRSLPSNFDPRNLAVLEMPRSQIIEIGKTWKNLTNLTSINLRGCEHLIKVSDLSEVPNLEHLDLSRCKSLVEVDHSVGRLDRLCKFNLEECSRLTNFPTSVTWKSLKHLYLTNCMMLEIFIESVNKMESIVKLDLRNTGIKELPSWIGYLTSLVELNLSGTPINELPSSMGNLTSLVKLDLSRTPVKQLPSSIGNLTSLVKLDLSRTPVKELPSSIGNLTTLEYLYLSGTPVKELPSSIGNVTSLVKLDLSRTPVKELPSSIENLTSLLELDLSITLVEELPSWIGNLTSLVELDASRTLIRDLPSSIGNLIELERLYLQECENLANVPDSVYGGLSLLGSLDLSWCPKLVTFPTNPDTCNSASSLFPQLYRLRFKGCNLVSVSDFLSNLDCTSTLAELYLSGSSFDSLPACITKFQELRTLDLSDCKWLRDIIELPPDIMHVDLHDCVALERFSTFSNILEQRGNRLFKEMDLRGCYRLVENLGIDELVSKFENAFRNEYGYEVKFTIPRGSEVPEWFDKYVLPLENPWEIVIEIPPCLRTHGTHGKFQTTGLAVCLVYETDPNYFCIIRTWSKENSIEIYGHRSEKRNGPTETEWSKVHDHVWLHCFPLEWSMRERYVIGISSELLSGDVMHIKSWGVHLINLAEDIPIDDGDCHNGEGAAAISELSTAAIPTQQGLQLVLYDDHPNIRISHQTRSSINSTLSSIKQADGAGPSNHHP